MATHIYSYACGHGEGTVKLYGLPSEQEQKLNKLKATSLCPACVRRSGPVVDIEEAIDQTIAGTMSRFPDTCMMLSIL